MWITNYFNELKAWRIVRKVYKKNRELFNIVGLKMDWVGRLYRVINRDPEIVLGSEEDRVYLNKELAEITNALVRTNIIDILAYELRPLEDATPIGNGKEEFENGYLIVLTPAWRLDRQYVTVWSFLFVNASIILSVYGCAWAVVKYLIPYIEGYL